MRLFGGNTKTKTRRRVNFAEKKEREEYNRAKKEQEILHNEYIKLLNSDPELKKQTVIKKYGLNMKAVDPVEVRRRQLADRLAEMALEKLESDPEFAEQMVQAEMERMKLEGGGYQEYDGDDDGHYGDSPFDEMDRAIDMYEKMKDKFGNGNGGTLSTVLNSELVKGLGPILMHLLQQQQSLDPLQMGKAQNPPQIRYVLPEEEKKPLPPPPQKSEEQLKEEQHVPEIPQAEVPEPTGEPDGILEWMKYLEDTPEVFVRDITQFANEGNFIAQSLLEMFQTKDADELIEELQPLKQKDDFRMFVEAIEAQPWWLEEVIKLSRGEE